MAVTWQFKGLILLGVIGLLTVWDGTTTKQRRGELDKRLEGYEQDPDSIFKGNVTESAVTEIYGYHDWYNDDCYYYFQRPYAESKPKVDREHNK